MNKSRLNTEHEERRKHPRIKLNTPVKSPNKTNKIKAMIRNISRGGLQIRSDNKALQDAIPYNEDLNKNNTQNVGVIFNLRFSSKNKEIKVDCKIRYVLNLSDNIKDNIVCGLQFMNFEGEGIKYIDDFLYSRDNDSYLVI